MGAAGAPAPSRIGRFIVCACASRSFNSGSCASVTRDTSNSNVHEAELALSATKQCGQARAVQAEEALKSEKLQHTMQMKSAKAEAEAEKVKAVTSAVAAEVANSLQIRQQLASAQAKVGLLEDQATQLRQETEKERALGREAWQKGFAAGQANLRELMAARSSSL